MKTHKNRPDETSFSAKITGNKILIVEDNDAYRQAVAMLLEDGLRSPPGGPTAEASRPPTSFCPTRSPSISTCRA